MVESQLRPNGVTDIRVLEAMGRIAREDFLPASARPVAYADLQLELGDGRSLNAPTVTGQMFDAARIAHGDAVLIVADEVGYVTALARSLAAGVVEERYGERHHEGPFDVIVVDGAVEDVDDGLIERLVVGGRLVGGVVENGVTRLAVGRKSASGFGLTATNEADVRVLSEGVKPPIFAF